MLATRRRHLLIPALLLLGILRAPAVESSDGEEAQSFVDNERDDSGQQVWQLFRPLQQRQEQQWQPLRFDVATVNAATGNGNSLAEDIFGAYPTPPQHKQQDKELVTPFPWWQQHFEQDISDDSAQAGPHALDPTYRGSCGVSPADRLTKRRSLGLSTYLQATPPAPRYAYAYQGTTSPKRPYKRQKTSRNSLTVTKFIPPLTADALKRPHHYFKGLQNNLRLGADALNPAQLRLLAGENPLKLLAKPALELGPADAAEVTHFLQALRTYEPSERVRSLVAQTPRGYRGSHLIDPNYMWIGLGK